MNCYHLSYDTKGMDSKELSDELAKIISDDLQGVVVHKPVESTFLFVTAKGYTEVFNAIGGKFSEEMFYILSAVWPFKDARFILLMHKNQVLDSNFQKSQFPERT